MVSYIRMHWQGKLPLAVSFWINLVLVNVILRLAGTWLEDNPLFEHPVLGARFAFLIFVLGVGVLYPWQFVGVWRSASRHAQESQKSFWPGAAYVVLVLGFLGTLVNVSTALPMLKELAQMGFGFDKYGDYEVTVTNNGQRLHLNGHLGFGVSEDVKEMLKKHPGVSGIILDSLGGRIFEGRQLSALIIENGLDTYTVSGCFSACTVAFVSGQTRYLAEGANLGFHQYRAMNGTEPYVDMVYEQEQDALIYRAQGVTQNFVDRVHNAGVDDLWYPTVDELLSANFVHDVVKPSDITQIEYGDIDFDLIESVLASDSTFAAIKRYSPEAYNAIIEGAKRDIRNGASEVEMQASVASVIETLGVESMPYASDQSVVRFIEVIAETLIKLEEKEPILCVQYLFPEQYGSFDIGTVLKMSEMQVMIDALGQVIVDRYETPAPEIDFAAAEDVLMEVVEQMGENVIYLEPFGLDNREAYSTACGAFLEFYERILNRPDNDAANALRYSFLDLEE